MHPFFKNLFKPRPKIAIKPASQPAIHSDLIARLTSLTSYEKLNELMYSPSSKIYLINTYSNTFSDLIDNLYTTSYQRSIIAINVHSYFSNSTIDLPTQLTRVVDHLPKVPKLNTLIDHDLHEICSTFDDLIQMEQENG
jgi:hypothetical protein